MFSYMYHLFTQSNMGFDNSLIISIMKSCRSNKEENEDKRDHLLPPPRTTVSSSVNSCLFRIFLNKNSDLQSLILVLISTFQSL